jgi:hypothetical protein
MSSPLAKEIVRKPQSPPYPGNIEAEENPTTALAQKATQPASAIGKR